MSALPNNRHPSGSMGRPLNPKADIYLKTQHVSKVPIVLQNSQNALRSQTRSNTPGKSP